MRWAILLATLLIAAPAVALDVQLTAIETQGVARTSEMVHNGVPLAKSDNVTDSSTLVIWDGSNAVPATFDVLARWGGGKDDDAKPIKWVLVSFPASVTASGTSTYRLRDFGTPAAPLGTLTVTDGATAITVNTGSAEFVVSETAFTAFDSIAVGGNAIASGNGGSQTTINGQAAASANPPTVTIERQNAHYVCIKAVGTYANTPVGVSNPQPIHYRLRYEFFAGSPTVVVTHKYSWPSGYGMSGSGTAVVDNISFALPDMVGLTTTDAYATSSINYTGVTGQAVSVSQDRRALFADDHQATVTSGASNQTTQFATHPAVISRTGNGDLVATIGNLKFYEPQRIAADAAGKITLNAMAAQHTLYEMMGSWSRYGIGALVSGATFTDIHAQAIAPVEHRLMALPDPAYLATSGVDGYLANPSSATTEVDDWNTKLQTIADYTRTWMQTEKFHGLLTWGTSVRLPTETGSGTGWDKLFEGATMTDYHNAWRQMTHYGLSYQDPDALSDFGFPAARRMLHTQGFQVDDYSNPYTTYMGWSPAGYQRFRFDTNSSHSYLENLYLYYYLTGDLEVVEFLEVGADTRDDWYTRDAGELNDQTQEDASWAACKGRVFYQTASTFDFLGHAGESRYLDDWRHMYNHATTRCILMLDDAGQERGFWVNHDEQTSGVDQGQTWMDSLYTMEGLYRLWLEYGDIQLGENNFEISRVVGAMARSFWDYNRTLDPGGHGLSPSDGTWAGAWSNSVLINFTGDPVGGSITSVTHNQWNSTSDMHLYSAGKVSVAAAIVKAGVITGDNSLKQNGFDGLTWAMGIGNLANTPLAKTPGIAMSRWSDAVNFFDHTPSSLTTYYRDADGDGYPRNETQQSDTDPGAEWYTTGELISLAIDCDDTPVSGAAINPGATEICGNAVDEDCSGAADACGEDVTCYKDADGDLYSDGTNEVVQTCSADYYEASQLTATSGDCNDTPGTGVSINPGASEENCNGIDEDCSGEDFCNSSNDGGSDSGSGGCFIKCLKRVP